MPRAGLHVRPATVADLPVLLDFGTELREQLGAASAGVDGGRSRGGPSLEERYRAAIEDPDRSLVLCVRAGDEPLAMAMLTVTPASALLDVPAVQLSSAIVPGRHRRRGAGKALVAAAADYAERRGIEQIVVSVNPGSRESNRFFARLGFAPLAVRRVASVPVVRRRLAEVRVGAAPEPAPGSSTGRSSGPTSGAMVRPRGPSRLRGPGRRAAVPLGRASSEP